MNAKLPKRASDVVPHLLAIVIAAAGCIGAAFWAKNQIENTTLTELQLALVQSGHDWADAAVDGLSVTLTGTAPDEATRFAALSTAGSVVDATRIIDEMSVQAARAIRPPDFSIEILKNEDGISLIGLVPTSSQPSEIVDRVNSIAGGADVTDLLESADFEQPSGWAPALDFGIEAVDALPRSKVSILPGRVAVTAVAKDEEDKQSIERRLRREAPAGVTLDLDITAPRPVVAPFTLRFVMDDQGARFDACAADSEAARDAILSAASSAGMVGSGDCVLGLGTPSTRWGEAAVAGIEALAKIGSGTLTLSNADVSLVAAEGTPEALFERTMGELEADLPPVFSLEAVLPVVENADAEGERAPPEFTAIRSPEGQVQLRGRIGDEATRAAIESFAAAHFGSDNIYPATRLDADLPPGWPKRVLAALDALQYVHNGVVTVTEDNIDIRGDTGIQDAQAEIARVLSSELGGSAQYQLKVTYSEALDPIAAIPTPEECIQMINEAGKKQKITFAPSSTEFEDESVETIDAIAEIIRDCQAARIEIGGHTDSQGREVMNAQLSQARADAVLNAIMARRVLVSNLSAKGYGETQPIADNGTEQGREANRRIEFRLVDADETEETAPTDATEDGVETDASEEETSE